MDAHRIRLMRRVEGIVPWDHQEAAHAAGALDWIASGAPLYRTRKPDIPDPHLVSYFVVLNGDGQLLLVAHRKAGLWLPSGGHVEPEEDPWRAVERECAEELHIPARPIRLTGPEPFFITCTRTRGAGSHIDVSLWFLLEADAVTSYDHTEFADVTWLAPRQVLDEPIEILDPHMHRFTRKLVSALR
ncbi:NUDIX domain-containing protein [Nonomuraea rhodomycinica]|uniref:NUDIX domain-containing protein n=1 Tax=Nonomuraea rhodomycinica TaxID=1712872 RepID=A0A7Y6IV89_9ACTN|nr:NUDIX domain-containing protein [Nonomuraea rhodomycinica]NUW44468.1 NUDIX domain-containing protein [Nonomuraea rhodomycinica]